MQMNYKANLPWLCFDETCISKTKAQVSLILRSSKESDHDFEPAYSYFKASMC